MPYLIVGLVLMVLVGAAALAVFLARRTGKGEKRKRARYTYSEKAQQAAGKSLVPGGPEKLDLRPPPVARDGTEELREAMDGPLVRMIRTTTKGVDASRFGRNIKTTPMKIDRRFLKGAPREEEVREVEEVKEARRIPEAPKVQEIQEIEDVQEIQDDTGPAP